MAGNKHLDPDQFRKTFEARWGEEILAYELGRYLSGWKEFDDNPAGPLWGLLVVTGGGLRFHHFAHENWLEALTRIGTGTEGPKEKTLFIPAGNILEVELKIQESWWKRLLFSTPPLFLLRYRDSEGREKILKVDTERKAKVLVEKLETLGQEGAETGVSIP
jgi:hypothetical protein